MEIITTTSECKKYSKSVYNNTIAYIGMQRKESLDSFHVGHEQCVAESKQHADKVMVGFMNLGEIFTNVYPEYGIYTSKSSEQIKQVCLQWCEQQNVDLVLWPERGTELSWVESFNLEELRAYVENVISTNNYFALDDYRKVLLRAAMLFTKIREDLDLYRIDVRVGSYKDGSWRLGMKHFLETYMNQVFISPEPIINPLTGFPYMSSIVDSILMPQKSFTEQLPSLIETGKSQIQIDVEQYKQDLLSSINALDTSGEFRALRVEVFYDLVWIDNNKAFIEIPLHVNNNFSGDSYLVYCEYIDL